MILIEHNGERQLVESLRGYRGCKVIERDVEHPPHAHCRREDGRWVEDEEAKRAADERARLNCLSRTELVEHIMKLVEERLRRV